MKVNQTGPGAPGLLLPNRDGRNPWDLSAAFNTVTGKPAAGPTAGGVTVTQRTSTGTVTKTDSDSEADHDCEFKPLD